MTDAPKPGSIRLERNYDAPPETIWELWTTAAGIESWWAPDGFSPAVQALELRPGGELVHSLTATSPEMVEFMNANGMPLTQPATKRFTEVTPPTRLAYVSNVDFVPDVEPYEHLTVVDITPAGDGTQVVMTVDPMHDEVWTERILAGRNNELDNLAKVVGQGAG